MSLFHLQQFSIEQSQSGMKVCSDTLLFGAMIPIEDARKVLDIGTGTGILSLMQAQKSQNASASQSVNITGVELTGEAAKEARKNFTTSPWADRLQVYQQDIQSFSKEFQPSAEQGYDLIICNPPFFDRHSKTQGGQALRHTARHTDSLSFVDLCQAIDRLISKLGRAYLLLPIMVLDDFYRIARNNQLYPHQQVSISESNQHKAKLAMVMLSRESCSDIHHSSIVKFQAINEHSSECKAFLSPYLLRYGSKQQCTRG